MDVVFSAVVTTGIYCRPGCSAKPRADNLRTYRLAAAAEAAGFRACLRCRPYRVSGSEPWAGPELVCRSIQLIIAGVLDEGGTEADLAARIGLSSRQLRRLFQRHVGLTPDQFARSRRAHFARRLLDDTDLAIAQIAFSSGFSSLRQFNRAMTDIFCESPRQLRARRRRSDRLVADGGLSLRLPVAADVEWSSALAALSETAIPGVEEVDGQTYRRTISLDAAPGLLEIAPDGADHLVLRAHLPYWEGLIHVVGRVTGLLGIAANVDSTTAPASPALGAWSPLEAVVQAVVAQDDEPPQARRQLAALVHLAGQRVPGLGSSLTHVFPSAEALREADLTGAGLSQALVERVHAVAAIVEERMDLSDDGIDTADSLAARLCTVPGVQPGTARRVARRIASSVESHPRGAASRPCRERDSWSVPG